MKFASSQECTTQGCRVKKKKNKKNKKTKSYGKDKESVVLESKPKFTQSVHGLSRQPATEIDWAVFLCYLEIVKDKLYSNLLLSGHP